jgi:hypothetical protein
MKREYELKDRLKDFQFPFLFSDYDKIKTRLVNDLTPEDVQPSEDVLRNVLKKKKDSVIDARFVPSLRDEMIKEIDRYFPSHADLPPYPSALRDSTRIENYKIHIAGMWFKREEVNNWIELHVLAPVPDAIQNGIVSQKEIPISSKLLEKMFKTKNIPAINKEFKRALDGIEKDPQASLTAACAIIESFCKVYIEENQLELPKNLTIKPLWSTVAKHLGFDPSRHEDNDQRQIVSGLSSIVDGIGALRTHAGSAHGRGQNGYQIQPRHARLAVSAAHTLVLFVLESWENK